MAPGSGDGSVGPIAADAHRRLEAIKAALLREMEQLLAKLNQSGGELVSTRDALDNARRIRTQVLALMREEGMPVVLGIAETKVADAVEAALGARQGVRSVVDLHTNLGVTMDAEAKDSIARSVRGVLDTVADVFGEGAASMRRAMDVGVSTSAPLGELVAEVRRTLETTFDRAQTAVETAIRGAARSTLINQAERSGEAAGETIVYVWLGPVDSKTRPICRENAGKAFTLAALKRMDNDQGLPVENFLGGWNCRHTASPLTRESAEDEGIEVIDG